MHFTTKDADGFKVEVTLDEHHLAVMVRKAMGSFAGKSRGGPVTVTLKRPRKVFLVSYHGRPAEEHYGHTTPARLPMSIEARTFSAEAAVSRACAQMAKSYNDGRIVSWRDCTAEEVK